jgi:hypothetical protein
MVRTKNPKEKPKQTDTTSMSGIWAMVRDNQSGMTVEENNNG